MQRDAADDAAALEARYDPELQTRQLRGWPTVIPLVVLIYVLFSGDTPYMAAFRAITSRVAGGLVNPYHRTSVHDLLEAFEVGARHALAVGASAATVGIVVGVINTTGVAFRLGFMVTAGALGIFTLGVALAGFVVTHAPLLLRLTTGLAAILLVAPGLTSDLYGAALVVPLLIQQWWRRKRRPAARSSASASGSQT